MGWGRKKRWGYNNPVLPKLEPQSGPVVGAFRLGSPFREEGIIAEGAASERWRLTCDINRLLDPDNEFIVGSSIEEIRDALELRHPSPVPGVSMIEIINDQELKRHTMPLGDLAITRREPNPYYGKNRYGDQYITIWLADRIDTLSQLCVGGNDLLISVEAEKHIRDDSDFDWSDLVIGKRDNWYSIVKYNPGKAAGRRKGRTTVSKKAQHAADLVAAGRDLRTAAAAAYSDLVDELKDFGVATVIDHVQPRRRGGYSYSEDSGHTTEVVRQLKALLVIHAALRGKHAYRHNDEWQDFLKAIRDRPKDLSDHTWGNYEDVKEWLAAECLIKRPKPTKKMIAAKQAAEAAALWARTCASCGTIADNASALTKPPFGCKTEYAPGAKLCGDCWGKDYSDATAEPVAAST